jgi:hypothetical protein
MRLPLPQTSASNQRASKPERLKLGSNSVVGTFLRLDRYMVVVSLRLCSSVSLPFLPVLTVLVVGGCLRFELPGLRFPVPWSPFPILGSRMFLSLALCGLPF